MRKLWLVSALALLCGCGSPTQFQGSAKVAGGPSGCQKICEGWGMQLAGMVAMGDYSTACVCQLPGRSVPVVAAGASAAAAAVVQQHKMSGAHIPPPAAPAGVVR